MSEVFDDKSASAVLLQVYSTVHPLLMGGKIEDVAQVVAALEYMKRELAEMHDQAKSILADLMGEAPEYSAGNFSFEKKQGAQRKSWDHKGLANVVAKRIVETSIDLDTGEVLRSPAEMIAAAFEFAGVSYWRVKELQKIGVNADSYCEVGEGKTNIIVRPNN